MKNNNSKSPNVTTGSKSENISSNFCFSTITGRDKSDEIKWFLDFGATEDLINRHLISQ